MFTTFLVALAAPEAVSEDAPAPVEAARVRCRREAAVTHCDFVAGSG
ncbi:hypothetical protein WJ438_40385 [Streptomyces sp. GD-15H]